MKSFTSRIYSVLNSPRFFRIVVYFFIFESIWIALSATYPQAFDENFHFGLIQTYSHYWLPFLSSQPAHADAYGAVARDPSYLYHYLMSFPYRVIALFVHSQIRQVILLRIINIGLLAGGLVLLRRIMLRVGLSRALTNISMLLFILIPIVPQLAAQINYDNLLILLVAWTILITFNLTDQIRKNKPSAKTALLLFVVCLFTSLVKYVFLPIFAGIVVFLLVIAFRSYHHQLRHMLADLWKSWGRLTIAVKILLVSLLVLSLGMFIQRDGINLIKYHTVSPDCAAVLSVKECTAYSPWYFNYTSHQVLESQISAGYPINHSNLIAYSASWIYWMWYRLFFAINGPTSSFTNYPPLPLPSAAGILLVVVGIIVFFRCWRRIFHNNLYLVLLFFISILYIGALFAQGYASYHYTNVLENMNGRYLLPVVLFFVAIIGTGFSIQFRNLKSFKAVLVAAIFLLFFEGGGFLTFISRSDDTWDVQSHVVQKVNDTARKITSPVIVNGNKQYSTKDWFFN